MRLVTKKPVTVPTHVLCVTLDKNCLNGVADARRMASLRVRIPNRNTPSPPSTLKNHLIQIIAAEDKKGATRAPFLVLFQS